MVVRWILLCLLLLNFLAISNVAFAQTLRCGGQIIKEGASKFYVLNHCGEPNSEETISYSVGRGQEEGQILYYVQSNRTFIVEIRRGEVSSIKVERRK